MTNTNTMINRATDGTTDTMINRTTDKTTDTITNIDIAQNILRMLRTKPNVISNVRQYSGEAKERGYRGYNKLKFIESAIKMESVTIKQVGDSLSRATQAPSFTIQDGLDAIEEVHRWLTRQ